MILIERFLSEHPFFCSLLEHEIRIFIHYIELYRCAKNSYLVWPNEFQEVMWIVMQGHLAEYAVADKTEDNTELPNENESKNEADNEAKNLDAELPSKKLQRYFRPGDLINNAALTSEFISENEIISLENDTLVICINAFNMAKLAQQQPKIHRALRPVISSDAYLLSGLPLPIWQQMSESSPPHARNLGKSWLQRQPLLRSHNSWFNVFVASLILGAANIWQLQKLPWETLPFLNTILATLSLLTLIFIVLRRYCHEYTLKRSLLHIAERSLFGLNSKIKSYAVLSICRVELRSIPVLTKFLGFGGLYLHIYPNEVVKISPLDRVQKWQRTLRELLQETRRQQEQIQHGAAAKQLQKRQNLQPKLVKEINYHNSEREGKLPRSLRALLLQTAPIAALGLVILYYSSQSALLKIYLTVPLYSFSLIVILQLLRWLRYSWKINEEFLLCYDNLLGRRNNHKISIAKIQELRLEYLNIFGFSTICMQVYDQIVRLKNLKNPQNILDEIESLRHYGKNFSLGAHFD